MWALISVSIVGRQVSFDCLSLRNEGCFAETKSISRSLHDLLKLRLYEVERHISSTYTLRTNIFFYLHNTHHYITIVHFPSPPSKGHAPQLGNCCSTWSTMGDTSPHYSFVLNDKVCCNYNINHSCVFIRLKGSVCLIKLSCLIQSYGT